MRDVGGSLVGVGRSPRRAAQPEHQSRSEIVFDYFSASMAAGTCKLPEALPLTQALNTFGEKILFGISPEKITGFLGKHGFKIIQSLAAENYQKAYFKGKAGKGGTVSELFFFMLAMVT